MPRDLKLSKDEKGLYDIDFENGDFALTDGLDTAIILSIFDERRASSSQVEEPSYRRGHFMNEFADIEGYEVGSLQWLYTQQNTNSNSNVTNIENALRTGLRWLIEDRIAKNVAVNAVKSGSGVQADIAIEGNSKEDSTYYNTFINTI